MVFGKANLGQCRVILFSDMLVWARSQQVCACVVVVVLVVVAVCVVVVVVVVVVAICVRACVIKTTHRQVSERGAIPHQPTPPTASTKPTKPTKTTRNKRTKQQGSAALRYEGHVTLNHHVKCERIGTEILRVEGRSLAAQPEVQWRPSAFFFSFFFFAHGVLCCLLPLAYSCPFLLLLPFFVALRSACSYAVFVPTFFFCFFLCSSQQSGVNRIPTS